MLRDPFVNEEFEPDLMCIVWVWGICPIDISLY